MLSQQRLVRPRFALTLLFIVASSALLAASASSRHRADAEKPAAAPEDTLVMPPVLKNISSVP